MGVFKKKPEVVDARQFTGGTQNGTDLVFWVESNEGHALWANSIGDKPERVLVEEDRYDYIPAFKGDWIVRHQNGKFAVMRNEVFIEEYDQV